MGRSIHDRMRRPPRGAQGNDHGNIYGNRNGNRNGNNRTFLLCSEPDILTLP